VNVIAILGHRACADDEKGGSKAPKLQLGSHWRVRS
jgi:hypothetical protein